MKENESEIVHKSINTDKESDKIDETEDQETAVTDNPVINEPIYFNLFKCGKNFLNKLDATCKRACMETSREKYYKEMYKTLTGYNEYNNMPLSNANILEAIRKVTEEE